MFGQRFLRKECHSKRKDNVLLYKGIACDQDNEETGCHKTAEIQLRCSLEVL